jgi:hypothetical protein
MSMIHEYVIHGYSIFCFVHDAQDQVQDCVIMIVIEVDMDNYTNLQFSNNHFTSKLVKALIVVTWQSFYQEKSTLTRTKLKHFHFRTCINNWLQYASNIVMFYSLICITYQTPLFFIACNLRNSLNTPAHCRQICS